MLRFPRGLFCAKLTNEVVDQRVVQHSCGGALSYSATGFESRFP
jgi:hypothetical protein